MSSDKKFWDSYEEFKVIPKNDKGDVIKIALATKGTKEYVDVRTFYLDEITLEMKPGKGISIPSDLADEIALAILESGERGKSDA